MDKVIVDEKNYIVYRPTPWDARVFGFNTNEILEVHYEDLNVLIRMLQLFDQYNHEVNVRFTYTRVDTADAVLRHALTKCSYYYAETSMRVTLPHMERENFGTRFKNDLPLTLPGEADFHQIREIARSSFDYSRFHEDYNVDKEKARARYYYWVDDLIAQGKNVFVFKTDSIVKCFLFYDTHDETVRLILGGSRRGSDTLSYYFWPSFLTHFQRKGFTRTTALISASNIGILNLYARLNFKFEQTLIGFHKFYDAQMPGGRV